MLLFKDWIAENLNTFVSDNDVNINIGNLSHIGTIETNFGILKGLFGSPKERGDNKIGWVIKFNSDSEVVRIYTNNKATLMSNKIWDVDGRKDGVLVSVIDLINTTETDIKENPK